MNELKTKNDLIELIESCGYENVIIFSNPDYASAFIGVSDDNRAVYDFQKMVEYLMREWDISEIESIEFIEYNTLRAIPYAGHSAPIIVYPLEF